MTFPSTINSGHWSALVIHTGGDAITATDTEAEFKAHFADATTDYVAVKHIREMPSFGTPPNVVNVPEYCRDISNQVQAQADAPSLEITLNYVPADWEPASTLGALVGNGQDYAFGFVFATAEPTVTTGLNMVIGAGNLGDVENAIFFFKGKLDALVVTPSLSDAVTATLTLTLSSKFYGPFTQNLV